MRLVAGRDGLDRKVWTPYEGMLARLSLGPFTEGEARDYLARKGITGEELAEVILGNLLMIEFSSSRCEYGTARRKPRMASRKFQKVGHTSSRKS